MTDEIRWLVGVVAGVLTFFAGGVIAAVRSLGARIDRLHGRVNDVRKEYVRRDDLDKHLESIDRRMSEIHSDQKEISADVRKLLRYAGPDPEAR